MGYGIANAYDGSGMKMAQVYDPSEDIWKASTSLMPMYKQNEYALGQIKQQQAPEMAKLGFEQQRWGQLYPMLAGIFNQMGQGRYSVGGRSGPGPHINAAPIWNQQQIDQRVNQMRAGNDATAASANQAMSNSLAGRGFGSNSPLAAMLGTINNQKALAANTTGENDLRYQAAQGNAQQQLAAQQAQEGQYASRMQEDIERRKTYTGMLGSLLGGLGAFR